MFNGVVTSHFFIHMTTILLIKNYTSNSKQTICITHLVQSSLMDLSLKFLGSLISLSQIKTGLKTSKRGLVTGLLCCRCDLSKLLVKTTTLMQKRCP